MSSAFPDRKDFPRQCPKLLSYLEITYSVVFEFLLSSTNRPCQWRVRLRGDIRGVSARSNHGQRCRTGISAGRYRVCPAGL